MLIATDETIVETIPTDHGRDSTVHLDPIAGEVLVRCAWAPHQPGGFPASQGITPQRADALARRVLPGARVYHHGVVTIVSTSGYAWFRHYSLPA